MCQVVRVTYEKIPRVCFGSPYHIQETWGAHTVVGLNPRRRNPKTPAFFLVDSIVKNGGIARFFWRAKGFTVEVNLFVDQK